MDGGRSQYLGTCNDPNGKREITIYGRQVESVLLNTLIHELIHACFFDLKEIVVENLGRNTANALIKSGFNIGRT